MRAALSAACALVLLAPLSADEPAGGHVLALRGAVPVPMAQVTARAEPLDGEGVRLAFRTDDALRRMVALDVRPVPELTGLRSLSVRCRVSLDTGPAPRLAAVAFEGARLRHVTADSPLPVGEWTAAGLPLDVLWGMWDDGEAAWQPDRFWLGLVFDGPAEGTFELAGVQLSAEAHRPRRPLSVPVVDASRWRVHMDPAVSAALTMAAEGPAGADCLRLEFAFPGGRHMWITPAFRLGAANLASYRALRMTYAAELPPGIAGLLVMLGEEGGAQYLADPPPGPSSDWTAVEVPFERFRLGSWTKDANGRLDPEQVLALTIGAHGTAAGQGGRGLVRVAEVQFVP